MKCLSAIAVGIAPGIALAFSSGAALAQPTIDPARVESTAVATFASAAPEWRTRVIQDEVLRICSATRNQPNAEQADKILAIERATVALPADGNVLGDWKRGDAVAQNGRGGQFSDTAGTVGGGNCYACHQITPTEISYGTLGPSLLNYGKDRKFDPEAARAAFVKVFNTQATVPCSMMPRFGRNGVLTEQQIKDVVALLFDPASPANK